MRLVLVVHKVKLNKSKLGNMFCSNTVTHAVVNNLVTAKYFLLFNLDNLFFLKLNIDYLI